MGKEMSKSVAGISVLAFLLLLHIIVFMTKAGFAQGFINAMVSAAGIVILSILVTITYALITKAKESLISGWLFTASLLILANLVRMAFNAWIAPMVGLQV